MDSRTVVQSESESKSKSAESVGSRDGKGKEVENEKQKKSSDDVQIPTDTSPYVQYADLEDYKEKAYGTPGHLPVVDRPHHGGGTDAPTLSGSGLPPNQPPQSQ